MPLESDEEKQGKKYPVETEEPWRCIASVNDDGDDVIHNQSGLEIPVLLFPKEVERQLDECPSGDKKN